MPSARQIHRMPDPLDMGDMGDAFLSSLMRRSIANAATARLCARPNPWVGAVVIDQEGAVYDGATEPPGSRHAERVAIDAAGDSVRGSTLFTTLEPCAHTGRTGPCADAIIESGVARVVIGVLDPDPNVAGLGMERLLAAGIDVTLGVESDAISAQLAPYFTQRRTGRPFVVLKLALTLDGFIAAPDGTSQWITGQEARSDVHRLRAESDVIVVGSQTVRADNPSLTVRGFTPALARESGASLDPWRVVLGSSAADLEARAKTSPYEAWDGGPAALLDELGTRGHLQVLVEGGGTTAGSFHRAGLVDEYWLYLAPAIMGGSDGRNAFAGEGAPTMADVQRGKFLDVTQLGDDIRLRYKSA